MDYSKMNDHEINVKVGEYMGFAAKLMAVNKQTDYCNNPADAGPIITSSRIGIVPGTTTDKWAAHHGDWDVAIADTNPLRAAMIVYLTLQESANVPANSTGSDIR